MYNKLRNKLNIVVNELIIKFMGRSWEIILINEFPKCGATWMRRLLSDILEIDKTKGNVSSTKKMGVLGPKSIIQRHWLQDKGVYKTIVMLRDPRDVFTSFYFYENYFIKNKCQQDKYGWDINDSDEKNLERYIIYKISNPADSTPGFSIEEFWNVYKSKENVLIIRYEDLLKYTKKEVVATLKYLGYENVDNSKIDRVIESNDMRNLKKLDKNKSDKQSFYRKGISGDWKNNFTKEAKEYFKKTYGSLLIEMEYESDKNW